MISILSKKHLFSLLLFWGFMTLHFSCKKDLPSPNENPPTTSHLDTCNFISFKMDGALCALDVFPKIFHYSLPAYEMNFSPFIEITEDQVETSIDNNIITNNAVNDLGWVKVNEELEVKFKFCDGREEMYQLIFTRFPIIQFTANEQLIYNDPKTPVGFRLNDPDFLQHNRLEREFVSYAGIELRGGSAQSYPKKSYAVEMWEDSLGTEKFDASLLGMREDDDWILDAMYIDKGRMRNRVSHDIWLDFAQLHYQNLEPNAVNGIHGNFVEIFIDNRYRGIYVFSERMDRKQLKLEKFENSENHGVLYKSVKWENGIISFQNYSDFDSQSDYWSGWEQKYPDPEDEEIDWNPLADFTWFVVNATDDEFKNQIGEQLNIQNAADYYIFLNLLRADDNSAKNIYFSKHQTSDAFFMVPWDMDGAWGRLWNGDATSPQGILSNNLFTRLLQTDAVNFKNILKQRWANSRNNIFTKNNLILYFQHYADLLETNGSFEREKLKWGIENTLEEEMNYLENWLEERLIFLDDYFVNL